MSYNEKLTDRIRAALAHLPNVEEKKMFRGVTFMVNGKMCVSVGDDEIMYRINPGIHQEALQKKGCRAMEMKDAQLKVMFM
jgi:TfoX/Sxy family transcriptional regulator of competence genes